MPHPVPYVLDLARASVVQLVDDLAPSTGFDEHRGARQPKPPDGLMQLVGGHQRRPPQAFVPGRRMGVQLLARKELQILDPVRQPHCDLHDLVSVPVSLRNRVVVPRSDVQFPLLEMLSS